MNRPRGYGWEASRTDSRKLARLWWGDLKGAFPETFILEIDQTID